MDAAEAAALAALGLPALLVAPAGEKFRDGQAREATNRILKLLVAQLSSEEPLVKRLADSIKAGQLRFQFFDKNDADLENPVTHPRNTTLICL